MSGCLFTKVEPGRTLQGRIDKGKKKKKHGKENKEREEVKRLPARI